MKKIAFHLNCLVHGGAERVVSNLANKFAEEGYDVYVTVEWIDKDEFRLDPRVHHVNVGLKPEDEKKGRWVKFGLRIKYLREFLKEVQPDVLCAFMHRPNFRALTAALGLRVPVIITIRSRFTADVPINFRSDGCFPMRQAACIRPRNRENSSSRICRRIPE